LRSNIARQANLTLAAKISRQRFKAWEFLRDFSKSRIVGQHPVIRHRRKPPAGHLQEVKLLVLFETIG